MDSLLEPEQSLSQHQVLDAPWGEIGRSLTLGFVASVSKLVLGVLNRLEVDGSETFLEHVMQREPGHGLITVSNHTSTVDDPVVLSALTPLSFFFTEYRHHGVRWSLCAAELCYRNPMLGQFFQSGKTLPISRGSGLEQPAMRAAAAAVGRGDWLHIFPEGRVVYTGTLGELRWGVGKLICDAMREDDGRQPTVLPLYHSGMGQVMPYRSRLPAVNQRVYVKVGQPVQLDDISCNCNRDGVDQQQVRRTYTIKRQREKWTEEEHYRFVQGLQLYGRQWKRIQDPLPLTASMMHAGLSTGSLSVSHPLSDRQPSVLSPETPSPLLPQRKSPAPGMLASLELAVSLAATAAVLAVVSAAGPEVEAELEARPIRGYPFFGLPPSSLRLLGRLAQMNASMEGGTGTEPEREPAPVSLTLPSLPVPWSTLGNSFHSTQTRDRSRSPVPLSADVQAQTPKLIVPRAVRVHVADGPGGVMAQRSPFHHSETAVDGRRGGSDQERVSPQDRAPGLIAIAAACHKLE